ncbi:DUF4294 domain-containing protein [Flavobacterium sp.]|jgi:hypothetical protein|uniref:DUF4294 domain-containing protein n=1 Tax=Flavobacterium sp. TaxID=239 RepID=UPI0037BFE4E6
MNKLFLFLFFLSTSVFSQTEQDTLKMTALDSAIVFSTELNEITINKDKTYTIGDDKKALLILKRRIFRVYPYAKLTAEKLTQLNETMNKLKTTKEKKKYFKIVEKYLEEEFEPRLKKLSRNDGKILVKLIHRQTGESTFDLIKHYKSGWKAFWANSTARMFSINLRATYKPYDEIEDYNIEAILYTAFRQGQLSRQEASTPINIDNLNKHWKSK